MNHTHPPLCPLEKTSTLKNNVAKESRCLNVDKFGAIASFACAVHCFITSIAMSALSVMGLGFFGSETTDTIFVIFALAFGIIAVKHGYKHHRSYVPFSLFIIGLTMVLVSHFWLGHAHIHHSHETIHHNEIPHWISDVLAVLGGITLMSFHFVNAALQRKAKKLSCCS